MDSIPLRKDITCREIMLNSICLILLINGCILKHQCQFGRSYSESELKLYLNRMHNGKSILN